MPYAHRPGIDLFYDVTGSDNDAPLLLICGLGMQSIDWPEEVVSALVDRGFRLITFDNRDVGLSTQVDGQRVDLEAAIAQAIGGEPSLAPYLLSDMAEDAVAVLDAVGVGQAHVVGVSMGGMIAQQLAVDHPSRVRSLTSIMSTTGDPDVGQPQPSAMGALLAPPATDRASAIEQAVKTGRVISSPEWFDEARAREAAAAAYDRCFRPDGVGRQLLSIISSGSRSEGLRRLSVPTLVVHGAADVLVDPSGGRRTAEVVPGAELLVVDGMGHDLPVQVTPQVVEAITAVAARAS